MSRDLLVCLLVVATVGFAVHAARPPPSLGRAEAPLSCDVPVEKTGAGVVCLTAAEARANGLLAGDKIASDALDVHYAARSAAAADSADAHADAGAGTGADGGAGTGAGAGVGGEGPNATSVARRSASRPAGGRVAIGRMAPDRLAAWRAGVDVNRATVEELASLDGIGPKLAARIAAARPFVTVDDVARVKGIGVRRLARLRARLVLDE